MTKKHQIRTVEDMLALSHDEFSRMLVDLVAWFDFVKRTGILMDGVESQGFFWRDDNKPGVTDVTLCVKETSEVINVKVGGANEHAG